MKIIKEGIMSIDKLEEIKEMINIYPIGSEVLIKDIIDGSAIYGIDKIKSIEIKDDGIIYYLEDAEKKIKEKDLIPYSITNEKILKEQGYYFVKTTFIFTD